MDGKHLHFRISPRLAVEVRRRFLQALEGGARPPAPGGAAGGGQGPARPVAAGGAGRAGEGGY